MLLFYYALILVLVVLLGAVANRFVSVNHQRTQLVMSFVSGIMLGVAVFHLLPHAVYGSDGVASIDYVAWWLMAGLLGMFLLQRLFHFHHHDFDEDYVTERQHEHGFSKSGWGVVLGLAVHSLMDGVALAASMQASFSAVGTAAGIAGLGVFIAILLHKPLDALTISIFLERAGIATVTRWIVLIFYALLCPVMAALALAGYDLLGGGAVIYIVAALAFSAGIFLCIALSDLLPEIHFHSHDRLKMTIALLAGIAVSQLVKHIESEHSHQLDLGGKSMHEHY